MNITFEIDEEKLAKILQAKADLVTHDEEAMLEIHNLLAKMCDPYVPMDEGYLSQSVHVFPEYIRYNGPYAHYMYVGMVYGPNIPIKDKAGNIIGWFSPPNQKKHPTGRQMTYDTEKHLLASREWDKAMMRDKKDSFLKQAEDILARRANALNV